MIALKINQAEYYLHKLAFVKMYKKFGLKWKENVELNRTKVDGWFNSDNSVYLLKLPEEGEFKRFKGISEEMIAWLKNVGAVEFSTDEIGYHRKDVQIEKNELTMFIGADLERFHRKFHEMLRKLPKDWKFAR